MLQSRGVKSAKYDGDGNRVNGTIGTSTTYYVGNYFEWTGATSTMVKYYSAGGSRVAMRIGSSTVYYLLADHLGGTNVTVTTTGVEYGEVRYRAFGETRYSSGTTPTTYRFTGQREEANLGLYFYNARWYDAYLSRWTQPDTDVPESQGVQAFDRYAYVNNSPVNYLDPSGHSVDCGMGESGCRAGSLSATQLVFERHQWLVRQVGAGNMNDLEALAQLSDYAASLTPDCTECYVENIGATLTGHTGNSYVNELLIQGEGVLNDNGINIDINASYNTNYEAIRGKKELKQSGYDSIFQDQGALGGNQAHHLWFYVQVGYESGMFTSIGGNLLHESVLANYQAGRSYQDFALGVEGAILGQMLSWGAMSPEDVGDYLRDTLSPGSQESEFWDGPN